MSWYQKKHSPTHIHRGHQISLSASSIYYHPWHPPYSIHAIAIYSLSPQSLSEFSLVYLLASHPPLHTPRISLPNLYLLFAAHAHTIATCFAIVPRLCHLILVSLSTLHLGLVVTHPSYRSDLCPLKCHLIFLSYRPCLTSMPHTSSHTTAVQFPSHWQWYIPNGKQWYQLPQFIASDSNTGLHSYNDLQALDGWRCSTYGLENSKRQPDLQYRKGDKTAPGNYQPVSLTSQICKIFESIIKDDLVLHLETQGLIRDSQHGFRHGISCLSNLLVFLDKVYVYW